jgi:hypothetical protein
MTPAAVLRTVKVLHTVAWAALVLVIAMVPVAAWRGDFGQAAVFAAIMFVEIAVLAANGMKCPLTTIAGRYTDDRRDNFDIYLPLWLATYNKRIFGTLFVLGLAFATLRWFTR